MKKLRLFAACLVILVFACAPEKQQPVTPLTLETRTIHQNKGTDCDKQPDSLRTDCAMVDFSVPNVQGANAQSQIGKNISAWVDKFLIHLLIWSDYPETDPTRSLKTVDAAIKRFWAIHDDAAGSVTSGQFKATCASNTLLKDEKYLTLMLDGFSFPGGNRALTEKEIATFFLKTGKQLTWDDITKDKSALLKMAEAKIRETRVDVFKEGFKFDTEDPLKLPSSYGLAPAGLLMHYQPDEIYGLGGATEFTIPYNEIDTLLKLAVSAPPAPAAIAHDTIIKAVPFLVKCSEKGEMTFEGKPMKSLEQLMAAIRPLLEQKIKAGLKTDELPEIETSGCLMGSSGAIRDYYNDLKATLTGKPAPIEKEKEKEIKHIDTKIKGIPAKPVTTVKAAPAKPHVPGVTLKQDGSMLVDGKQVSDLETLRKVLQEALLKESVLPDKIELKTVGETGMGLRGEINTIITESINGAKWIRKKNAIGALNTAVGKKLGAATQLELVQYQTSGDMAYLIARIKQADGSEVDFSKTAYAKDAKLDNFTNKTVGLLQYDKGAWKVLTYSIGISTPPADAWIKKYNAPKALFGIKK